MSFKSLEEEKHYSQNCTRTMMSHHLCCCTFSTCQSPSTTYTTVLREFSYTFIEAIHEVCCFMSSRLKAENIDLKSKNHTVSKDLISKPRKVIFLVIRTLSLTFHQKEITLKLPEMHLKYTVSSHISLLKMF